MIPSSIDSQLHTLTRIEQNHNEICLASLRMGEFSCSMQSVSNNTCIDCERLTACKRPRLCTPDDNRSILELTAVHPLRRRTSPSSYRPISNQYCLAHSRPPIAYFKNEQYDSLIPLPPSSCQAHHSQYRRFFGTYTSST